MTTLIVTTHAAERFVERHAPHMANTIEARRYIEANFALCGRLKERTINGQEQWRLPEPRCILVGKRDPNNSIVIVTVLPEFQDYPTLSDHERSLLAEHLDAEERLEREAIAEAQRQAEERQRLKHEREQRGAAQRAATRLERLNLRRALRVLLHAAMGRLDTEYALDTIREIDPSYLEPAFLEARDDQPITKTDSSGEAA